MHYIKELFNPDKKSTAILEIPKDMEVVRDYDIFNIPITSFDIYTFEHIPNMKDVFEQIFKYHSPGLRSLNYWLSHPKKIPDKFKEKENLCMGILIKDRNEHYFVPAFSYSDLDAKWHSRFFCLNLEEIIPSNYGILILRDIQNIG